MEAVPSTPIYNGFVLFRGRSYMHTQASLWFVDIMGHNEYRKEPSLNHLAGIFPPPLLRLRRLNSRYVGICGFVEISTKRHLFF